MDPLLVTFAAIIATPVTGVLGAWIGFALGRRTRIPPTPYVCGCGHPLGMHDQHCHGTRIQERMNDEDGRFIGRQLLQCECRRYVGDFPVDQVDWSRVQLPTRGGTDG